MGAQWDGGPVTRRPNDTGAQRDGGSKGRGAKETGAQWHVFLLLQKSVGAQWDGGPMRRGPSETGAQRANPIFCFLQKQTCRVQKLKIIYDGQTNLRRGVCLLVGCLTSQQQASVSQGRICSDNFTCCHTEIEVADPTFYLTQSQYTDTGPTSPSVDPITPGAWQGSHWNANF